MHPALTFEQILEHSYFDNVITVGGERIRTVDELARLCSVKDEAKRTEAVAAIETYSNFMNASMRAIHMALDIPRDSRIFNTDEGLFIKVRVDPVPSDRMDSRSRARPTYEPDFDLLVRVRRFLALFQK